MIKRILAGSFAALVLVGCGGGGSNSGTSLAYGVNACPNVGSLSITANGTAVLNSAAYGSSSSAFVSVNAGANSSIFLTNSGSTQLASGSTTFTSGSYYTTWAIGNAINQYVFVYPQDVAAPTANFGKLVFVNGSVLQPSVDVYVTLSGNTQGPANISSMTPFNSGVETPAQLAVGTYDVQFKVAGTTTVLVDIPAVTIGSTPASNEIQIVGIADSPTGSATAQQALPIISVPVIAGASAPRELGHPTVIGHPNMTSFPKNMISSPK